MTRCSVYPTPKNVKMMRLSFQKGFLITTAPLCPATENATRMVPGVGRRPLSATRWGPALNSLLQTMSNGLPSMPYNRTATRAGEWSVNSSLSPQTRIAPELCIGPTPSAAFGTFRVAAVLRTSTTQSRVGLLGGVPSDTTAPP